MTETILRDVDGLQLVAVEGVGLCARRGDEITAGGYIDKHDAAPLCFMPADEFAARIEQALDEWYEESYECGYCEARCEGDYSDDEHYYCSSDCKEESAYLARYNGDQYAEHRTY